MNRLIFKLVTVAAVAVCLGLVLWALYAFTRKPGLGRVGDGISSLTSHPAGNHAAAAGKDFTNSIGMKFVRIAPGEFLMGSPADETDRDTTETQHKVKLTNGFYMATTPVTQAQWKALIEDNPSHIQGDDLPVETVSYIQAVAFCSKLSQKEGKHYQLPTEAQWEYACRAGTTSMYYTGATWQALKDAGWYSENSHDQTHPVGQKKPNAWGLYDMLGNVYQWCADWYGDYNGDATNPTGPASGEQRVLRGGSWFSGPAGCRSASRFSNAPDDQSNNFGFRVCLPLDAE